MSESEMQEMRKGINYVERDVNDLKIRLTKSEIFTERILETIDKFEAVMSSLQTTMNDMQTAMLKISMNMEASNNAVDKLSKKVDNLSDKVEVVENKGSFDITGWIKENFIKLVFSFCIIAYFISVYVRTA